MGTHPIFESDFDCLTEMRSFLIYRQVNGVPRRVLSASAKLCGGHGVSHEGDHPAPKQFLEAAAFLSEKQRPNPIPLSEKDMTPELIAEKAAKYNMLPEDYYPMSLKFGGAAYGDYPVTAEESYFNRPGTYEWDNFNLRRNMGQPIGKNEMVVYGSCNLLFDGHYHPYGFWQWWQHIRLYITAVFISLIPMAFMEIDRLFGKTNSYNAKVYTDLSSGKMLYQQWWSHQELEFKDIYLKMAQARMGYPGRSDVDQVPRSMDSTNHLLGPHGTSAGRDRHGPTGASFIRTEPQETYMVPAGNMAFKMGHFTKGATFAANSAYDLGQAVDSDAPARQLSTDASHHLSHGAGTLGSVVCDQVVTRE